VTRSMKIDLVLSTSQSYRDAVERGHPYRPYAPLTLAQLAALVPEELDAKVRITDLTQERLPSLDDADIVAISSITCGIPSAYALADRMRSRGATVVIGGSHATALPDEAQDHADAVVVGYAERTWPALLRDWKAGRLRKRYVDFSNPFSGRAVIPDRRLNASKGYLFNATAEASRGCPNGCSFCATACLNSGRVFLRPLAALREDLDSLGDSILFLDSNFTENHPPEGELFSLLGERGLSVYAGGSLKLAEDPGCVALAAKRGLRGLLVGFESIVAESVSGVGKTFNRPSAYADAIRVLHDYGIKILGCFVFGFDGDDESVFDRTVEFAEKNHIDIVRFSIVTPLPGTVLYRQLDSQGRILERDWKLYDTEHVVFRPALMRPEKLADGLRMAYRQSYSLPSAFRRLVGAPFWLPSILGNLVFRSLAYTFDSARPRKKRGCPDRENQGAMYT
jgi:radical SAM superfamily enzyme YgiQ (UPF0313 family)